MAQTDHPEPIPGAYEKMILADRPESHGQTHVRGKLALLKLMN